MSALQGICVTLIVIALYGWGAVIDGADRLTEGTITAVASTACSGLQAARHARGTP